MSDLMKRDEQPQTTAIAPVANMSEFLALAKEFERSGMFGCSQPGQGSSPALYMHDRSDQPD